MKLLMVEDDVVLASLLRDGLEEDGHIVDVAHDGIQGEAAATNSQYDAIILDVMIPGKDGFAVLSSLREQRNTIPVLMLTARDAPNDVVSGLDRGADDYLRKPFDYSELLARLRTITRREGMSVQLDLRVDDLVFNLATRRVTRAGEEVRLTARETSYLEYFMRNVGLLVTRRMLEVALWDGEAQVGSNVIEVYVARLRNKIERSGRPRLLHTIRGAGYRFGVAG